MFQTVLIFDLCFFRCENLINIFTIDNWNISKEADFTSMFTGCDKSEVMKGIKKWNILKDQLELITKI